MLWFILVLFVFGIIFGMLARLLVPGRDRMGIVATWAVGIAGSFIGGFLAYALLGADIDDGPVQVGGVISSIIGAVLVVLLVRVLRGGRRPA